MKKTAFIYDPIYLKHDTGHHPECIDRLNSINKELEHEGLLKDLVQITPQRATDDEILANHTTQHYNHMQSTRGSETFSYDSDTIICADSYDAAMVAAGAGITAVDKVLSGEVDNAFCAVRPPGHHAERHKPMGFCIFNNVAVAARYARTLKGINRVFIFDWDVHHGNGTQNSFYEQSDIYYASFHQYPFYPGSGSAEERGRGEGEGYNINYPIHAYCGDKEYLENMERLVYVIEDYKPDIIFISAGFDAHHDDPLSSMRVSSRLFGRMTVIMKNLSNHLCDGRLISILEGGYHLEALSRSVVYHLMHMMEE